MENWFCRAFHFCLPKTETKSESGKLIPTKFDPSYVPQKKQSATAEELDIKNVEGYTAIENDTTEKDIKTVLPVKQEKEVGKDNLISPPVRSSQDGENP